MNELMEFNQLIENITFKDDTDHELLKSKGAFILEFNKRHENKFKFIILEDIFKRKLGESLNDSIEKSMKYLNESKNNKESNSIRDLHVKYLIYMLNTIRILSRDSRLIDSFEINDLLCKIQDLANFVTEEILSSDELKVDEKSLFYKTDILNVNALKVISNLIYNSTYIQTFYGENGLAEAITAHLKLFNPHTYTIITSKDSVSLDENHKFNIMIFGLRIIFLLSIFNKNCRQKLKDHSQVVTYLLKNIDQIMKARLSLNLDDANIPINKSENIDNHQSEFCFLKSVDIDYINEALKVLFNLTMETSSLKHNFAKTIGDVGSSKIQNHEISKSVSEEEEAHFMKLVSVLRNLMTSKIEKSKNSEIFKNNFIKQDELQGNIINLLTNIPMNFFEELILCLPKSSIKNSVDSSGDTLQDSSNNSNQIIRIAHNNNIISCKSMSRLDVQKSHEEKTVNDEFKISFMSKDEDFEFEGKNLEAISLILSFMSKNVTNYLEKPSGHNADQLYPVLLLLSLMSKSNRTIRHYCRLKILPPLKTKDIIDLPQQGNSLRNRLVRLMTDANIQLKRLSAQFLFILCKESVSRLVKYSGYGNAAGLLAESGLMLSSYGDRNAYSSNSEESDTEDYKKLENLINPITGRVEVDESNLKVEEHEEKRFFRLKKDLFEGMSEEQKEFEAIQIVNAIDKMTRSGAIKPATIGPDGRPVEMQHVLQLQENKISLNK